MNIDEIALKLTEIYVSNFNVTEKKILTQKEIGEIYNNYSKHLHTQFGSVYYKGD